MRHIDKINPFMNIDAIKAFSDRHGNLSNKLKNVIHVAGTNGKGSTIAFLRSILEESGYTVNVFTSPHLVNENERIRIDGKLISNELSTELDDFIVQDILGKKLSVFEKFMAKALIAFNKFPADFNIFEVGLGGRLDATNIFDTPLISIITPIDLDHQHILGNTKTEIAKEKAAIIKNKCLVVSSYQSLEVMKVIKDVSNEKNASLLMGGQDWKLVTTISKDNESNYLQFKDKSLVLNNIGLKGRHQLYNASLAIVALKEVLGDNLNDNFINLGIQKVKWPGRLQSITSKCLYNTAFNSKDLIFLDGAHNEHGAKSLLDYINENLNNTNVYMIIAMLKTKVLENYLSIFKNVKNLKLYSVSLPEDFKAYSAKEIKYVAERLSIETKSCLSVKEALNDINNIKNNRKLIIICGSLYLIGKILKDNNIIPT